MLNISDLVSPGPDDKGFILLTLSSLEGDEAQDHTPLLISVKQLLVDLNAMGTSPHEVTSTMVSPPATSTVCPSPTPAVRETAFITLTVTSQCPQQSTPITSHPATTSREVQTPSSTEPPSSGITIDQLMITRMTFVAIVVAIVLCVLVLILLVGCGVCFLCTRRRSLHQKSVNLVESRSTMESTI